MSFKRKTFHFKKGEPVTYQKSHHSQRSNYTSSQVQFKDIIMGDHRFKLNEVLKQQIKRNQSEELIEIKKKFTFSKISHPKTRKLSEQITLQSKVSMNAPNSKRRKSKLEPLTPTKRKESDLLE